LSRAADIHQISKTIIDGEQKLAQVDNLIDLFSPEMTLNEVRSKIELTLDNLSYCLLRDRINNKKPR